jgi:hypothetical protein
MITALRRAVRAAALGTLPVAALPVAALAIAALAVLARGADRFGWPAALILELRFTFTAPKSPSPVRVVLELFLTGTKLSVFWSNSWFPESVYAPHPA